jgi:flagellar basal body-associated protein FliL
MTAQLSTPSTRPDQKAPDGRRRRLRNIAAVVAGVALIAVGGYAATTTIGPDAHPSQAAPATSTDIAPTDRVMRDLRESTTNLYGPRPSSNIAPSDQVKQQLDQTVRALYGPRR